MRIDCIVLRESHEETTVALVSADLDDDEIGGEHTPPDYLFQAIREAVTDWVLETDEGRQALERSGRDYNIGDLAQDLGRGELLDRLLDHGVSDLTVNCVSDDAGHCWQFDDRLYDRKAKDKRHG